MCAVAGIVNTVTDQETRRIIEAMTSAQAHRGPDANGIFVTDNAAFGHARLSIIDIDGSKQPIVTSDGKTVLVFNGEIYNFRQLRKELTARGHNFATNGDAECIIHLYEQLGDECVRKLDGMFAFALYDIPKRKLLLARDRLGKKPLLYFMSGETLIFASEFSGLSAHPAMPRELDKEALSDFLSLQYIPAPDTAYRKVRKLPPGHLLTLNGDSGQISIRGYWQPDYSLKNTSLTFDSAVAELRRLVEKAVEKRLVSDVPLGTFLSGGVDSCIVTGVASKLLYPAPCDAFTAGFGTSAYDERGAAQHTAEIINRVSGGNLRCHEREIKPDDFSMVEKLLSHFGEVFADASAIPFYLLSKFAKEHISVALSGDGADEIFAGYERYLAMRYAEKLYHIPLSLRGPFFNMLASCLPDYGERTKSGRIRRMLRLFAAPARTGYFNLLDRCPAHIKNELFGPELQEVLSRNSADRLTGMDWELIASDKVEQLGELDLLTYLPGDILVKADIASMANSLELRSPFMDTAVVEFAARLPMKYKLFGKQRKMILKAAFPEFVTPEIANRPKRGFGVPVASWLRNEWRDEVYEKLFNDSCLTEDGFVKPDILKKYWLLHQNSKHDFSYLLWGLLVLELFLKRNRQNSNQ